MIAETLVHAGGKVPRKNTLALDIVEKGGGAADIGEKMFAGF